MKRNAALFFAAFYLLIASGTYVCAVSCGSNSLIDFFRFTSSHDHHDLSTDDPHANHTDRTGHTNKKDCGGDKDCACCKKHGNYIVKENVKTADVQVPDCYYSFLVINQAPVNNHYLFNNENTARPKNHAPPPGNKIPLFIKIRSILI